MKKTNNKKNNLKPSWKQIALGISLSMMLITLNGCALGSQGSFCSIYQPVYVAHEDTEDTKSQVDANNAVWWEFCDE